MSEFKQTWWDVYLTTKFEEFSSWIGDSSALTKKLFREYVKERKYKSLIDLGCGTATEYFAYKEEYPELSYLGVDSSEFLFKRNTELGVLMVLAPAEKVPVEDSKFDVVYSRHVLEHQPTFQPVLSEMIRLARKEAIHVFFMPPNDEPEHIGYDSSQNLYHNRYNRKDIEDYLNSNKKVKEFTWQHMNTESSLIIKIKKATN